MPLEKINKFHKEGFIQVDEAGLNPNEFILLVNETNLRHTALGRYFGGKIVSLYYERCVPWGIMARNLEQKFLMEALLNPEIQLVTALGKAGTGKSILSMAAGCFQSIDEERYSKVVIYKPVIPIGRDLGYLPGSVDEKLMPWMSSVYDSFEFILNSCDNDIFNRYGSLEKYEAVGKNKLDELVTRNKVELSALTYIRGRSMPNLFIIVDEAQNLFPHELKTLISRAGEGTKIVLIGDIEQIDHSSLNNSSNGLVYTVERFKGQDIFAHVVLSKTERSSLSALAAELM